jgi:hypothetical protein
VGRWRAATRGVLPHPRSVRVADGTEYETRFSRLREQVLAMKEIWTRDGGDPRFEALQRRFRLPS